MSPLITIKTSQVTIFIFQVPLGAPCRVRIQVPLRVRENKDRNSGWFAEANFHDFLFESVTTAWEHVIIYSNWVPANKLKTCYNHKRNNFAILPILVLRIITTNTTNTIWPDSPIYWDPLGFLSDPCVDGIRSVGPGVSNWQSPRACWIQWNSWKLRLTDIHQPDIHYLRHSSPTS